MSSTFFWVHALTPLHVGSGRGLGYIDLPIVREKVTNFPYIPGSAVKGVIADHYLATDDKRKQDSLEAAAFGRQGRDEKDHSNSGSLVFTDARLVCLPVRSLYGTFAWCTSPTILHRLKRDAESTGRMCSLEIPTLTKETALCPADSILTRGREPEKKIYLEDLDVPTTDNETAKKWGDFVAEKVFQSEDREEFVKRFVILADDVFNFLCETGTEVAAHIKIDSKTKTVADGALWYEESLPAEAILAGIIWCDRVYGKTDTFTVKKLWDEYVKDIPLLQFGGKATTGKGLVRCLFDKSTSDAQGGK